VKPPALVAGPPRPDRNVGVSGRRVRTNGLLPRRWGLARLLLCPIAGLLSMSGCIIPVAPDFQDPTPNYPPILTAQAPAFGMIQRITSSQEFDVLVWDPNGDTVWVQWWVDYPRFQTGVSIPINGLNPVPYPTNLNSQTMLSATVGCGNTPSRPQDTLHQLELIVSDRMPIPNDDGSPGLVPDPGFTVRADWPYYLTCPPTSTAGSP
jgi:hypothetical protein